ncbi:discoidin domain-containing protein [Homoserinibacter gongjuensis]|jgi:hypothetical protein|uniref:F5/8 type C domain-containing protein n=1 Tax=Homoserinibacter gongjuensis TaxID=1162968 RepID=A0ABQ6JU22_9MICO|nr:discoidin domain-containing protein [Homoserinibacter gongjuensis]GMA90317.1 hypothetical protein GCM10025869_08460 [Homoserinibacter gongjuensis]
MSPSTRRPRGLLAILAILPIVAAVIAAPVSAAADPLPISLNKPTSSSGVNAAAANDADPSNTGGYFDAELTGGHDAWWQVDLQGIYSLSSLTNRNYVDGVRFYHYYVRVSLDGENWSAPIAWKYNDIPAQNAETFAVTGVGRYVRVNIISNSANSSAHLTNFEVYGDPITQTVAPAIKVVDATLDQATYLTGETPELSYELSNVSGSSATVSDAYAIVFGLTDPSYRRFTQIESGLALAANATHADTSSLWQVDGGMPVGSYGVFVRVRLDDGRTWEQYQTFFRVTDGSQLTTFDIGVEDYSGFPVYTLGGGLSAEYAVQKSAQILSQSAGPSWTPSASGYGPAPVYATPAFLEHAIAETITTLDTALGSTRTFETVVVAPGIQSAPQLIRTLQAPVLPLHFLVSFDSIYELRTVLQGAADAGYEVMATMGYDGSMDPGVAWIKLLEPPSEYVDFIERHGVRDVVLAGTSDSSGGENASRRVLYTGAPTSGHNPGDIFVIYPGGGTTIDVSNLAQRVHDTSDLPLAATLENISDWEAGLLPEQATAFASAIAPVISGDVTKLTAGTYYDIDNLGVYVTAAFYAKNSSALAVGGQTVRGIALSPYMTNQPFADSTEGLLPVLFFQGESSLTIVEGRLLNIAQSALTHYFPNTDVTDLPVKVITSRNFGGFANTGIRDRLDEFDFASWDFGTTCPGTVTSCIDEVWDPSDGYDTWNEKAVTGLAAVRTQGQWTTWNSSLVPLDLTDLSDIALTFPNLTFTTLS